MNMSLANPSQLKPRRPRVLLFDVFGTLVDWRSSIAAQVQRSLGRLGLEVDAWAFADAWRAQYQPTMQRVRSGEWPYSKLDVLHRINLDQVLRDFGLDNQVPAAMRDDLNRAWHRLDAWPDVGPGLQALRAQALLAPCSNGNVLLMAQLARHNAWHWDAIVGADWARDYKPQPAVYKAAVAAFDLAPDEAMMVAAHGADLEAAAACGLQTAFIARPDEHGPGKGEVLPGGRVDHHCASLAELAIALQARS